VISRLFFRKLSHRQAGLPAAAGMTLTAALAEIPGAAMAPVSPDRVRAFKHSLSCILNGVLTGAVYALIALGLTLVYACCTSSTLPMARC